MKQEIKWQHGLPTTLGFYLVTTSKGIISTDEWKFMGWSNHNMNDVIGWVSLNDLQPCKPCKFKWIARCSDGAFEDESEKSFTSKEECYNDMRNHALEKMKWNTEFYDFDDMQDGEFIGYDVRFMKDKIVHRSHSGLYVYKILKD